MKELLIAAFIVVTFRFALGSEAFAEDKIYGSDIARQKALDANKVWIIFLPGSNPRPIKDAIVSVDYRQNMYSGADLNMIHFARRSDDGKYMEYFAKISDQATDAQIEAVYNPWGPGASQEYVRSLWPKNVPLGKNLKFYSLNRLYQNMWTESSRPHWRADDIGDFEEHPFFVSGGMKDISQNEWKSVKGLDIPDGLKIKVWKEDVNVRAFAPTQRFRWQFPEKTLAYDVLMTKDDKIFAIRVQEKLETGWSDGDTYGPDDKGAWGIATKRTGNIPDYAPRGYHGAGQACVNCHSHTAEILSVPGRVYLRNRWGDDGRFSWRPFKEDGSLDARWPISIGK